jgi:nicotinate-nucleotide adenylyltransferase
MLRGVDKNLNILTGEIIKIALFGTSANPPTVGHQNILKWLSDRFDLVAVWAADNPYKHWQISLDDRMEMLRLSIAEINPPKNNLRVYPELSDRRTLNTVNKAIDVWGDQVEYTLVIGADLVQQICNWYRVEEIFKLTTLLIIPRSNYQILVDDLQIIERLGGKWSIANLDTPNVSSSSYRLEEKNEVISPAVARYIEQKRLYDRQLLTIPSLKA